MNSFNPFHSSSEMRRRYKEFQVWQRIVIAVIVAAWIVLGYVGYRLLVHFGVL